MGHLISAIGRNQAGPVREPKVEPVTQGGRRETEEQPEGIGEVAPRVGTQIHDRPQPEVRPASAFVQWNKALTNLSDDGEKKIIEGGLVLSSIRQQGSNPARAEIMLGKTAIEIGIAAMIDAGDAPFPSGPAQRGEERTT